MSFLPFAVPDIGEDEIAEVADSMRSGWITTGPKTRVFETDFAKYLDGRVEAVSVNSATAGLHLAVEALGLAPGDEVITTTHTFTATAEVVRYVGAAPVFVDIDLESYCACPAAIERSVSGRTKAIIPVHFAGHPCEMNRILGFARKHGIRVIEDAAHALPTWYGGRLIGTLDSDATIFSFYATKTIATGEGGMLVTRDSSVASRARIMRLHGIDRDAFDRYVSNRPAWFYEVVAPGFKYNLTDLAAAIGIHQLRRCGQFHTRREQIAARYDKELAGLPLILPPRPDPATGSRHAWHLYVIRLGEGAKVARNEVIARMHEQGVGCSVHYIPLHRQPYWRDRYRLEPAQFPNSELLFQQGISLPIYTRMSVDDQTRVIDSLRSIL